MTLKPYLLLHPLTLPLLALLSMLRITQKVTTNL